MYLRGTRYQGSGADYLVRGFMICTPHPISFVRVIKSRIMRWEGHVARMGERRGEV
jgi:hypothetical protein